MLASCGGSRSGSTGAGGAGAASGQGGGSAIGGTDSVGLGCDGGCPADQYCSEIGSCIDDGTCAANGDCVEGLECDIASGLCVPGSECGGAEIDVTVVASNLLIELDRSCSMTAKVGGVKKWLIAANSLSKLTTQYASKIRFGLALFPDTVEPKCEQAAIAIPVAPDQESAIQSLMTASLAKNDPNYPNGPCVTNIDTAMKQAYEDPALDDPARPETVAHQLRFDPVGGDSVAERSHCGRFVRGAFADGVRSYGQFAVRPKSPTNYIFFAKVVNFPSNHESRSAFQFTNIRG
jgi:hypothetical protein